MHEAASTNLLVTTGAINIGKQQESETKRIVGIDKKSLINKFNAIDLDSNGTISLEEMESFLTNLITYTNTILSRVSAWKALWTYEIE